MKTIIFSDPRLFSRTIPDISDKHKPLIITNHFTLSQSTGKCSALTLSSYFLSISQPSSLLEIPQIKSILKSVGFFIFSYSLIHSFAYLINICSMKDFVSKLKNRTYKSLPQCVHPQI